MKATLTLLAFSILLLLSCQTVTISPEGKKHKISSHPSYERTQNFFLWGLSGENTINVEDICREKPIKQMQTQMTFVNGLLSFITFGIYTPRTAKVWCKK